MNWEQIHGGLTHFPIALLVLAFLCDTAGFVWRGAEGELQIASRYSLGIGALLSLLTVASGLALSHGVLGGKGNLGWHHRFVWPAFGLLLALAVWRWLVREPVPRRTWLIYYLVLLGAVGVMSAAGYYGGELLLSGA